MSTRVVLRTKKLKHRFRGGPEFQFPDLSCSTGHHMLISGKSGVGKSTLLYLISGLLAVQSGSVVVCDTEIATLDPGRMDDFRGQNIGLVFQWPRFIASLNAIENLLAAQHFSLGSTNRDAANDLLAQLDIAHKAKSKTQLLSGGERQRLAIARALVAGPSLVLADEPTSNLDDGNAGRVANLLLNEADKNQATLLVVSHDARLIPYFHNRLEL